jgi:general secretion pathway protein C
MHLFGIVDKKNLTYQKTKNTRLNLSLIGILNQGKKSLAIIKYKSKDNIYQIGDMIASGVTIKDIKKKYIILSRHGQLEKLVLIQKSIKKFVTNNNKVSKLSVSQKNKVKKYQKQLLTNPVSLFALVGIKPKYVNNKLSGFSLFPTKERKLFYDLGFKKGDILIEINQNKLININQAMQLGRELANQTNFDLTVKRNQQIKILSISL